LETLKNFISDEAGMETLEYALIAGLIAIVALLVYVNSEWKSTLLNRLSNAASAS